MSAASETVNSQRVSRVACVLNPNPTPAAGTKAAVCELPFGRVASAHVGGAGGTCVLRGCVPKKLMVFGGEFAEAFRDSVEFGCGVPALP